MKTIGSLRNEFLTDLSNIYDQEEIRNLFQIAAEQLLNISRMQLSLQLQQQLSPELSLAFENILQQLKTGRPIQHIIGHAPFYGLDFIVSEDTLIPRPETEELVDLIIQENLKKENLKIIDIGTGTGCIAISLQKHLTSAKVTAVDISAEALSIAKQNASKNQCSIDFRCLDILEWNLTFDENEYFDIIVSNPPYITQDEKNAMHQNVLQFEPHTALFVEDAAPLLFYDYISSFALSQLNKDGILYFEINQYLANETQDLLIKKGFSNVEIIHDINGAARIIRATI